MNKHGIKVEEISDGGGENLYQQSAESFFNPGINGNTQTT
jgi:hypothetical protein